jgi:hypothetical protein
MKVYTIQPAIVGMPNGDWLVREDSIDLIRTIAKCPTREDATRIANAMRQVAAESNDPKLWECTEIY